jgi:hypothetical protein
MSETANKKAAVVGLKVEKNSYTIGFKLATVQLLMRHKTNHNPKPLMATIQTRFPQVDNQSEPGRYMQ